MTTLMRNNVCASRGSSAVFTPSARKTSTCSSSSNNVQGTSCRLKKHAHTVQTCASIMLIHFFRVVCQQNDMKHTLDGIIYDDSRVSQRLRRTLSGSSSQVVSSAPVQCVATRTAILHRYVVSQTVMCRVRRVARGCRAEFVHHLHQ